MVQVHLGSVLVAFMDGPRGDDHGVDEMIVMMMMMMMMMMV